MPDVVAQQRIRAIMRVSITIALIAYALISGQSIPILFIND